MFFLPFIIWHFIAGTVNGYNSYIVICPDTVRPGMEFTVQLNKLYTQLPKIFFNAEIVTASKSIVGNTMNVASDAKSAQLVLNLPLDLPSAKYKFNVEAKNSKGLVVFKNTTDLSYMEKGISIFIQTDKAIYKPGQKVQFRTFGTNPDLSLVYKTFDIAMYDPNNNKISQWVNVDDPSGVYQGELQLSDQPPLGDWKIEAIQGGTSSTKTFTVDEYVLPKFEVKVIVPSFGITSDKGLSVKVEAKYTFGKGVKGNGTLTIKRKYDPGEIKHYFTINGVENVIISLKSLEDKFGNLNYAILELVAGVEEGLTGNIRSGSTEITYHDREEKLVFMDGAENFKPGLKYTCYLFLSDQDDKPLGSKDSQINVTVTMRYGTKNLEPIPRPEPMPLENRAKIALPFPPRPTKRPNEKFVLGPKTLNVPKNGILPFTFSIPIFITDITIEAKSQKLRQFKYLDKFNSPSHTFIQISLKTRNPQTGKKCKFSVQSTVSKISVNYMIISKGLIVNGGVFKIKKKSKNFKVKITADMAPSARCVVYWTKDGGEVIADSVQFDIVGIFKNKVGIDYITSNVSEPSRDQPGKNVTIRIRADADSQCNVLTVDKSVLLLKSGNDITPSTVEQELNSYDSQAPPPCRGFPCWRSFYPLPVQGVDVTSIFENSGLKVLTDGFLYRKPYIPEYRMFMAMAREDAPAVLKSKTVSKGKGPGQGPRVRTLFPETWVYESAKANSKGKAIIKATVPDTITSWVMTAFAVNKKSGLGVAPTPANLEVFWKFFIRLELPYSVIRGEQIILQANIFNFYEEIIEVDVVLKKSSSFQNIIVKKSGGKSTLEFKQMQIKRRIKVAPGGGTTLNFPIVAVEVGDIAIEISAVSSVAGDAVRKQMLVEPEGIAESYNIPVLIDLQNAKSFNEQLKITLPDDVVDDSVRIRATAIGDLMGPSISGIASLVKMPYGCGEQNMINFVPNIYVLKYLTTVNNLKPDVENKALGFMLVGYQKELSYQHFDGSFSAFGNSDTFGSTWLTAYVVKSFSQAKAYIFIDSNAVRRAIDWLLGQYKSKSATFNEPGKVLHTEMQGGSANGEFKLAIFTLIGLLEAKRAKFSSSIPDKMSSTITGVTNAIEDEVKDMEDIYELAIASYALALVKSSKLKNALDKLDAKATNSGGMKYWEMEVEPDTSNLRWIPPHSQAKSRNIETTAYVLLAYATSAKVTEGIPVVRWLVNQRNPTGGFGSTQDTVIALQALAEFAALIYSKNTNVQIKLEGTPTNFGHVFEINQQNALLLQSVDVPPLTKIIDVKASGKGMALVDIAVNYNVFEDVITPLFFLKLSFTDEKMSGFKLKACFRWLGKGSSGMAILEVGLLSGFAGDKFSISQLGILKRVEDGDKKLVLYFDEIPADKNTCLDIRMQREGLVVGSQPAVVKISDYYKPENHAYSLYQPRLLKDANVCSLLKEELGC